MIRRSISRLTIVSLIFIVAACDRGYEDCHDSMYLENRSGSTIYYLSTLKEGFMNYDPSNPTYSADYRIAAGENRKIRIGITLSCWEQVLSNAGGYLYIYIFDAERVDSEGWNNVKETPLKRYKLSANQLKETGWQVSYP
ncbi:hypothetical protein [Petrimonas mucosa]|jgi:hypothetical protein|uniref:hypothetical protein n=1 Tax=Petrimonas mucosa TaxID=1642646 RepID=UPI0017554242|nr:hypothetical protein [Petrimonas mucosa]MDD3561893.1 hypothetical protein [Petrimonas mucosa]HHT29467.1 hypothetical protein [Petrimonas mucosa]